MKNSQNTKEMIARAAIELISARGVDAVSMRDIAARVGVSEAAIYRHFPNKSELVWEVFTTNYDLFAENLERLQKTERSLEAKLRVMVEDCCDVFDTDPELFTFLLIAQHIQRSAPKDFEAAMPAMLNKLLLSATDSGEIPPIDTEVTTAMIMGTVLQTALYCTYYKPEPKKMKPYVDALAAACWRIAKGN